MDVVMNNQKFKNAYLKIDRSRELIAEISEFVVKNPPYTYALETNTITNERATFAKVSQFSIDKVVILCGDVFHNLSSALDYAYWEAVSPHVADVSKHKNIQFPFAKDSTKLEAAVKSRFAHQVSRNFYNGILAVKPHAGDGGNILLNLIHETNIVDKHKFPIPVGDFTKISSEMIRKQVPDFPAGLINCAFGQNKRDVAWKSKLFNPSDIGEIVPPFTCLFHKPLNVPVDLVFSIHEPRYTEPVIVTFQNMVIEVKKILRIMDGLL